MLFEIYDLYSSIVVLSSVLIGFTIGKGNLLRSLLITRDIAIPIGISGALIDFVAMLSALSEPITLFPAMKVALLPPFYAILLSLFVQPIIHTLQQIATKRRLIVLAETPSANRLPLPYCPSYSQQLSISTSKKI